MKSKGNAKTKASLRRFNSSVRKSSGYMTLPPGKCTVSVNVILHVLIPDVDAWFTSSSKVIYVHILVRYAVSTSETKHTKYEPRQSYRSINQFSVWQVERLKMCPPTCRSEPFRNYPTYYSCSCWQNRLSRICPQSETTYCLGYTNFIKTEAY